MAPRDPLTEQHYLKWGSTSPRYSIFNKLGGNTFFAYFIIPKALETFEEIRLIWSFHFIWLSKTTPRYFTHIFCSIASPDILKCACISSPLSLSSSFLLVPIIIDVVLVTFKVSLFPCSHFLRFSSSVFMDCVISSILLEAYAKLVSSAYIVTFELWSESDMSLMNNRNNRGPKQDPCGTPQLIFWKFEDMPLTIS